MLSPLFGFSQYILLNVRDWGDENRLPMTINAPPTFRFRLNEEESTHITAHVLGVLGVSEVRGVDWKPVARGQGAPASLSVQVLQE